MLILLYFLRFVSYGELHPGFVNDFFALIPVINDGNFGANFLIPRPRLFFKIIIMLPLHIKSLVNSPLTISYMDSYLIDVHISAKAMLFIAVPLANIVRPIILLDYNEF